MNKEQIKVFVVKAAKKKLALLGLENEKLSDSTDLVREGIFDSLSFVDLIADCENEFSVVIKLEKYPAAEFTQLGKLAQIIFESEKNNI